MRQLVLNIPDNKYFPFLKYLKSKFSDIQIKENHTKVDNEVWEEGSAYETMLLSEESLAKDWLSEEDGKWDDVL
ncbi:MAG: hypothetical protein PF486_13490 [Prolixibacteraceae bacterium]|jgi:hypothetical protein|nr:hypothetical protein [Prolixibacteraceae bacterium]